MSTHKSSSEISRAQARQALLRSGYLLEARLETVLRNRDTFYLVDANSAVPDPDTGKSRELDLYAMAPFRAGPDETDFIYGILLIECINNPQPIAFLTKDPQVGFMHYHEVKLAGLPVKIPLEGETDSWEMLADFLAMHKYHHYCKGRVATQFCSFIRKRAEHEWMATHDEAHFDSFRKLCAAVDHFADRHFKDWSFDNHESINLEFYYPLVVVQGDLLDVRPSTSSCTFHQADHIQYRRSAVVAQDAQDYQIDVVTEQFFPTYLGIVEGELSKTSRLLRRRHLVVRDAIDRIAQQASRVRSPKKRRAAMDF
jgi:hypothetical protein